MRPAESIPQQAAAPNQPAQDRAPRTADGRSEAVSHIDMISAVLAAAEQPPSPRTKSVVVQLAEPPARQTAPAERPQQNLQESPQKIPRQNLSESVRTNQPSDLTLPSPIPLDSSPVRTQQGADANHNSSVQQQMLPDSVLELPPPPLSAQGGYGADAHHAYFVASEHYNYDPQGQAAAAAAYYSGVYPWPATYGPMYANVHPHAGSYPPHFHPSDPFLSHQQPATTTHDNPPAQNAHSAEKSSRMAGPPIAPAPGPSSTTSYTSRLLHPAPPSASAQLPTQPPASRGRPRGRPRLRRDHVSKHQHQYRQTTLQFAHEASAPNDVSSSSTASSISTTAAPAPNLDPSVGYAYANQMPGTPTAQHQQHMDPSAFDHSGMVSYAPMYHVYPPPSTPYYYPQQPMSAPPAVGQVAPQSTPTSSSTSRQQRRSYMLDDLDPYLVTANLQAPLTGLSRLIIDSDTQLPTAHKKSTDRRVLAPQDLLDVMMISRFIETVGPDLIPSYTPSPPSIPDHQHNFVALIDDVLYPHTHYNHLLSLISQLLSIYTKLVLDDIALVPSHVYRHVHDFFTSQDDTDMSIDITKTEFVDIPVDYMMRILMHMVSEIMSLQTMRSWIMDLETRVAETRYARQTRHVEWQDITKQVDEVYKQLVSLKQEKEELEKRLSGKNDENAKKDVDENGSRDLKTADVAPAADGTSRNDHDATSKPSSVRTSNRLPASADTSTTFIEKLTSSISNDDKQIIDLDSDSNDVVIQPTASKPSLNAMTSDECQSRLDDITNQIQLLQSQLRELESRITVLEHDDMIDKRRLSLLLSVHGPHAGGGLIGAGVQSGLNDVFLGLDRYGRAYWWCVVWPGNSAMNSSTNEHSAEKENGVPTSVMMALNAVSASPATPVFGILVEHAHSSIDSDSGTPNQLDADDMATIIMPGYSIFTTLESVYSFMKSLCLRGVRERSLHQTLDRKLTEMKKLHGNPTPSTHPSSSSIVLDHATIDPMESQSMAIEMDGKFKIDADELSGSVVSMIKSVEAFCQWIMMITGARVEASSSQPTASVSETNILMAEKPVSALNNVVAVSVSSNGVGGDHQHVLDDGVAAELSSQSVYMMELSNLMNTSATPTPTNQTPVASQQTTAAASNPSAQRTPYTVYFGSRLRDKVVELGQLCGVPEPDVQQIQAVDMLTVKDVQKIVRVWAGLSTSDFPDTDTTFNFQPTKTSAVGTDDTKADVPLPSTYLTPSYVRDLDMTTTLTDCIAWCAQSIQTIASDIEYTQREQDMIRERDRARRDAEMKRKLEMEMEGMVTTVTRSGRRVAQRVLKKNNVSAAAAAGNHVNANHADVDTSHDAADVSMETDASLVGRTHADTSASHMDDISESVQSTESHRRRGRSKASNRSKTKSRRSNDDDDAELGLATSGRRSMRSSTANATKHSHASNASDRRQTRRSSSSTTSDPSTPVQTTRRRRLHNQHDHDDVAHDRLSPHESPAGASSASDVLMPNHASSRSGRNVNSIDDDDDYEERDDNNVDAEEDDAQLHRNDVFEISDDDDEDEMPVKRSTRSLKPTPNPSSRTKRKKPSHRKPIQIRLETDTEDNDDDDAVEGVSESAQSGSRQRRSSRSTRSQVYRTDTDDDQPDDLTLPSIRNMRGHVSGAVVAIHVDESDTTDDVDRRDTGKQARRRITRSSR